MENVSMLKTDKRLPIEIGKRASKVLSQERKVTEKELRDSFGDLISFFPHPDETISKLVWMHNEKYYNNQK